MTDKEKIAQLEAENAALKADPVSAKAAAEKAANAKKRADLKAATKKKDGLAYYRIPTAHYGQGILHAAGSIVRLPVDEEPSHTWEVVKDGAAVAVEVPVAAAAVAGSKRASDKDVA